MSEFSKIELEQKFEEARKEVEHYKRIAEQTGNLFLRETETLSKLILWHKQVERDLATFKTAIESSINAIGITDLEGRLIYVNNSSVKMWGYNSKDEILGRFLSEFWEGDGHLKSVEALREKGTASGEDVGKRKDGSLFFFQFTASMFKDEAGNPSFMFGSFFDITERKQAEEALRESEKRYRAVVDSQTEMICRFLPDGTLTFVNEAYCRFFDKNREELIGHKFISLIPEEDQENVFKNIAFLNSSAPIIMHEHRVLDANGEIFWHKWTNRTIFNDQGKLLEYQAVGWDITERVHAEEELRKAHDELEHRVEERTRELEIKTNSLAEINTAMKVLLKKRDEDKKDIEDNVLTNVKKLVEPYFEKIKKTKLNDQQKTFLSILESNLKEITSPFTRIMSMKYLNLTTTEMRIANLIKFGNSTKKMAELLNISPRTVETHRKNIRRKIGLEGKKANLRTYLLSLH